MNRRILVPLAAVSSVLIATSVVSRSGSTEAAAVAGALRSLPARGVAFASTMPIERHPWAFIAAAALAVLLAALLIRGRRRESPAFGLDLMGGMERTVQSPIGASRKMAVARLMESGRSVAAIARETRLGQDAVRCLVRIR